MFGSTRSHLVSFKVSSPCSLCSSAGSRLRHGAQVLSLSAWKGLGLQEGADGSGGDTWKGAQSPCGSSTEPAAHLPCRGSLLRAQCDPSPAPGDRHCCLGPSKGRGNCHPGVRCVSYPAPLASPRAGMQLLPPPSHVSSPVCDRAGVTTKAQLHHSSQTSNYSHLQGLHLQLSHVCCDSGVALLSGEAECRSEQLCCLLEEITCLCSEPLFWTCLLSHSSIWQGLPGMYDSRH